MLLTRPSRALCAGPWLFAGMQGALQLGTGLAAGGKPKNKPHQQTKNNPPDTLPHTDTLTYTDPFLPQHLKGSYHLKSD